MAKYGVLLHVRNVSMQDEDGPAQLAGAYVNCVVHAEDPETAGNVAIDLARAHPKYLALQSWPPGDSRVRPSVEVDSVERLNWWRRPFKRGIHPGFIFYVDTDLEENAETRKMHEAHEAQEEED